MGRGAKVVSGTVSVRGREGKEVRGVPFDDFLEKVAAERESRSLEPSTF